MLLLKEREGSVNGGEAVTTSERQELKGRLHVVGCLLLLVSPWKSWEVVGGIDLLVLPLGSWVATSERQELKGLLLLVSPLLESWGVTSVGSQAGRL